MKKAQGTPGNLKEPQVNPKETLLTLYSLFMYLNRVIMHLFTKFEYLGRKLIITYIQPQETQLTPSNLQNTPRTTQ